MPKANIQIAIVARTSAMTPNATGVSVSLLIRHVHVPKALLASVRAASVSVASVYNAKYNRCERKPTGPVISCAGGVVLKSRNRATAPARCSCPKGKKATRVGKNAYRCVPSRPVCKRPRFKNKQGNCTCGVGKTYNAKKNSCSRIVIAPRTCSKGQRKVTSSKSYNKLKRQGWSLVRKGSFWCGRRPIVIQTCAKLGKIGKWPKCRNKPRMTCAKLGKIGRWPKCRNKPIIRKPKMTCAKIGKIGKWPQVPQQTSDPQAEDDLR